MAWTMVMILYGTQMTGISLSHQQVLYEDSMSCKYRSMDFNKAISEFDVATSVGDIKIRFQCIEVYVPKV